MDDVALDSLLTEFNKERDKLLPSMANERGHVSEHLKNIKPDAWIRNKAAIYRFAKEPENIQDWDEDHRASYRANMATYQASLEAAHRYIAARSSGNIVRRLFDFWGMFRIS